jgi:hypothetical protein
MAVSAVLQDGGDVYSGVTYVILGAADIARSSQPTPLPTAVPTTLPSYLYSSEATVDLAAFGSSPNRGVQFLGGMAGANTGVSVSGAGDFNNDGKPDLIVGARFYGVGGAAYIVLGGSGMLTSYDFSVTTSNAQVLRLIGRQFGGEFGGSVSSAGDFNNDGFDDVIIGGAMEDINGNLRAGVAYVVYGHAGPFSDILMANFSSGARGLRITGDAANDRTGKVGEAGDVNDDGCGDVIIGASNAGPGGLSWAGATYVVFGFSATPTTDLQLASITVGQGFRILGMEAGAYSGVAVSGGGDFNGDGYRDVLVGAHAANAQRGAVYVVYGHAAPHITVQLDFEFGATGLKIMGALESDRTGRAVSFA